MPRVCLVVGVGRPSQIGAVDAAAVVHDAKVDECANQEVDLPAQGAHEQMKDA